MSSAGSVAEVAMVVEEVEEEEGEGEEVAEAAVTWETPDPRRTPSRRPTAPSTIPPAGSTVR